MNEVISGFLLANVANILNMIEWLLLIVFIAFQGFIVTELTKWIDAALDYGHIFDYIRLWKARKVAKKLGVFESWDKAFNELTTLKDFDLRLQRIDDHYWKLTLKDKSFVLWLCKNCMSARMNLLFWFLASLFYFITAPGASLLIIAFYFITSVAFTSYFINRK